MGWNYVATFSPTRRWSLFGAPAGSMDESGTLWVMCGDRLQNQNLVYFSHSHLQNKTAVSVDPTTLPQQTFTSSCLMQVHGQLVALWRGGVTLQSVCWGVLDPKTASLSRAVIPGGTIWGGPLAAFVSATDSLFVEWSADGTAPDTNFYYSNVVGLGTPNNAELIATRDRRPAPFVPYNSSQSPAVAAMPKGGIAMVWRVRGKRELRFASAPDPEEPVLSEAILVSSAAKDWASLAVHGTGPKAALVVVFLSASEDQLGRRISYRVSKDGKLWTAPPQDGTVPLGDLLAHAGDEGSAVKLTNPVAAWMTAPGSSDTLYLLVGDRPENQDAIEGPLYLVRYTGENA